MDFEKECNRLKGLLEQVQAEKVAFDQAYLESIKQNMGLRKDMVLLNAQLQKYASEISGLKGEKDSLDAKIKDLESSLHVLKPIEAELVA